MNSTCITRNGIPRDRDSHKTQHKKQNIAELGASLFAFAFMPNIRPKTRQHNSFLGFMVINEYRKTNGMQTEFGIKYSENFACKLSEILRKCFSTCKPECIIKFTNVTIDGEFICIPAE